MHSLMYTPYDYLKDVKQYDVPYIMCENLHAMGNGHNWYI